ncbi:MAG: carboxypeptidase regulatory-like domain-containing protein [Gemmatimonadota bacterium]
MRFRVPSRHFIRSLCLAIGLPVAARAQDLPSGTITGTVLVTGTDAPNEGAQITVLTTERRALTDARGRFVLTGIATGIWRLQVRAIGYAPQIVPEPTAPSPDSSSSRAGIRERVSRPSARSISVWIVGGVCAARRS